MVKTNSSKFGLIVSALLTGHLHLLRCRYNLAFQLRLECSFKTGKKMGKQTMLIEGEIYDAH